MFEELKLVAMTFCFFKRLWFVASQFEELGFMQPEVIWLIDHSNLNLTIFLQLNLTIDKNIYFFKRSNNRAIVIHEMYKVSSTVIVNKVGLWTEKQGLIFSKIPFWSRRANFHGLEITGATLQDPPFTVVQNVDPNSGTVTATGMVQDLWAELERRLNFSTTLILGSDGTWGNLKPDGTVNGMIGMLHQKEVDVAVEAFILLQDRIQVADFIVPFFEEL